MPNHQLFISEGYIFLAGMLFDMPSGGVPLLPFLEIDTSNIRGEQGVTTSSFVNAYKAKLYTSFPNSIVGQINDIGNRAQTEPYIRKILEVYLLAFSSLYLEAAQFLFDNTLPLAQGQQIPGNITPLDVTLEDGNYRRLFTEQTLIGVGGRVSNAQLGAGPLTRPLDLSLQRFRLVKPMGSGAVLRGMPSDPVQILAGHRIIEFYAQSIRRKRNDRILIKSLDFLRRALVLERYGFYNEAYINYYRIIEAFANTYRTREIGSFLRQTFGMNVSIAKRLIRARNSVAAHGCETLSYLREIGSFELYRIEECAFSLIELRLT